MWPEEASQFYELSNNHVLYEPSCQMRSCFECSTEPCSMPVAANVYGGNEEYHPQGWADSSIHKQTIYANYEQQQHQMQYHHLRDGSNDQMTILPPKEDKQRECTIQLDLENVTNIPLNDLVDIVMQTVENVKNAEPRAKELDLITKKKEQNKRAAIRYRERQKMKWEKMKTDKEQLERRNRALKKTVEILEKEAAKVRAELLSVR